MKILKEIVSLLVRKNYQHLFILMDEFENSLRPIEVHEHRPHESERIRRQIGSPPAISQLASLSMLSGVDSLLLQKRVLGSMVSGREG